MRKAFTIYSQQAMRKAFVLCVIRKTGIYSLIKFNDYDI